MIVLTSHFKIPERATFPTLIIAYHRALVVGERHSARLRHECQQLALETLDHMSSTPKTLGERLHVKQELISDIVTLDKGDAVNGLHDILISLWTLAVHCLGVTDSFCEIILIRSLQLELIVIMSCYCHCFF